MVGHGSPVLSVQIGINLIEDVERCRISSLDSEDEGETTQT